MLEVKNKRAKWLADVVVHVNAAFSKDMPCLMYHILVRPGKNEKTPTSGSRRRLEIDLLCCGSLLYPIYMSQFDPGSSGSVIGKMTINLQGWYWVQFGQPCSNMRAYLSRIDDADPRIKMRLVQVFALASRSTDAQSNQGTNGLQARL